MPFYDDHKKPAGTLAMITDITELKRQIEAKEFLSKATEILSSSLDYTTTLAAVAKLAVPRIADWCGIDIIDEKGSLNRLALEHVDPTKIELAYEFQRTYPPDPKARQGAFEVVRSGKSEILPVLTDEMIELGVVDERQKEMIYALGFKSYMIVPLKARGKTMGVITFVTGVESGVFYDERDLVVAEELAHYAALAIDNSLLHTQAQNELRERVSTEEKIRHQALHDSLTNLPNRIFLQEQLTQACRKAMREKKRCGILFLDLDRFKLVNDSLGHHAGDELLKIVAERLLESIGPSDTVARFGGDEFVIITNNASTDEDLVVLAKKIFKALEVPVYIYDQDVYVNTSIGIAIYPTDSKNIQTLIKHADSALYCAKDEGRSTFCFHSSQGGKDASKRLSLESDLRLALKNTQFELHYQPVYSIVQERIISAEALIRWNHPSQGLLSPASFLSYAEDTGIIHRLGRWIMQDACRQLVEWSKTELKDIAVAVNISPLQFFRPDFVSQFKEIIEVTGADPHKITLEITENVAMQHIDTVIIRLNELKALGFKIAIDDFGVGHSSLGYLKMLPIDTLKIDKSFVQSALHSIADDAIVTAVSTLARTLDLNVIAEGVEGEEHVRHLCSNGSCDQIQGYAVSKPLSSKDFHSFVIRGAPLLGTLA